MSRPEEGVEARQPEAIQQQAKGRPTETAVPPRLDAVVDQSVSEIERRFLRRLRSRLRTLKRHVPHLIRVKLPPRPRHSGRPPRVHITRAVEIYRQQKQELRQGKRAEITWAPIGIECIPGFWRFRSEL